MTQNHRPSSVLVGLVVTLAALLVVLVLASAWAPVSRATDVPDLDPPGYWTTECIDCPHQFAVLGDRTLGLDAEGHPHIAYGCYHAYHDGTSWQIEEFAGGGLGTSLALDDRGSPAISWTGTGMSVAWNDRHRQRQDHVDAKTMLNSMISNGHTAIDRDSMGYPHVAYGSTLSAGLRYARYDGDAWHVEKISEFPLTNVSFALDSGDQPHICSSGFSSSDYTWHDGTEWQHISFDRASYCSLALTSDDLPALAYCTGEGEIRYARHDGTSWQTETAWADSCTGLSLALDLKDRPVICYASSEGPACAWHTGSGWRQHRLAEDGRDPSVAISADGHAHLSYWTYLEGLFYVHYDGTDWQVEFIDPFGRAGWYNALALDPGGQPHVSYVGDWDEKPGYAWYDGSGWHHEYIDDPGPVSHAALAIDSDGIPHLSYFVGGELRYAWRDATQWYTETLDSSASSGGVAVALDPDQQPHVAYNHRLPEGEGDLELRHAWHDGEQWQFETVDEESALSMALKVGSDGIPRIGFIRFNNDDGYKLKYGWRDRDSWQIEIVKTEAVKSDIALALDSENNPHISYGHGWGDTVHHVWHNGRRWQDELVVFGGWSNRTSIALDQADGVHISYYDSIENNYEHAWFDGAEWQTEVVVNAVGGGTLPQGEHSLAIDPSGRPLFSYFHSGNQHLKLARWYPGPNPKPVYLPLIFR